MQEELLRRDGENELEYHKRLVYGKLIDGTLSDADYVELSEYLYGKKYSSDVARRMMYGSNKTLQLIDNIIEKKLVSDTSDSIISELEEKKIEIDKARKKLQATKIEWNRNLRLDSRHELFYENIKDSIERIDPPNFEVIEYPDSDKEYILGIADIHAGANFKSINNEYSLDICERRFNILLNKTIKYLSDNNISKLKILELGDSIQGLLRLTDMSLNETSVVESVVRISKILTHFLNELSAYCYIEYNHIQSSNHSQTRPLASKANELANEDMEYIIVNYVKDSLANNERIYVNIDSDKDRIIFNIFDYECIALHGHQIKNYSESIKNLSMLHRKFFNYVFMAHLHGGNIIQSIDDTEIIVVPSFVGSCPFSDSILKGSSPMCQIYEFDRYEGHIGTHNIKLKG